MTLKLELTRPDDLLHLKVEGDNLRLDDHGSADPVLVIDQPDRPAYLTFTFAPQSIGEQCFFEASIVDPDTGLPLAPESNPADLDPDPDIAKTGNDPLLPPGVVRARIAEPSRLVFLVPPESRIAFSSAGLLDWSKLQPSLHPIAAIPAKPSAADIAAAPAISAPTDRQTALEMPYRLTISPNGDGRWAHRCVPFTNNGRTELWHTRLQLAAADGPMELSRDNTAPLRAIWSPDYKPSAPPDANLEDPDLIRAAMSPSDRHQIVILTSAFHGYEVDRKLDFVIERSAGSLERASIFTRTAPYIPQPLRAERLMLSALGGWLRSRGNWNPPRTSRPPIIFQPLLFTELFEGTNIDRAFDAGSPQNASADDLGTMEAKFTDVKARIDPDIIFDRPPFPHSQRPFEELDLSEWVHIATQGRDHYIRIVYEGELWPFRNRAALIKVTERKFREEGGVVIAYLFQRMFIVVREPEKTFAGTDRAMPFKRVRLTTLVTPDIALPEKIAGTQRSFWVDVLAPGRTRFKFHAVGTDVAGEAVDFTIPMLFVSKKEEAATRKIAASAYNTSTDPVTLNARGAVIPGQKLTFAERNAAKPSDNTQLITRALNFIMDASGNAPRMLKADVNIPQVQELLGSDAPTTIRYFEDYVKNGIDAGTGVFAEIATEDFSKLKSENPLNGMVATTLGVDFASDQAGGFATPDMSISTLTRELGPLAGKATKAVTDDFDPAEFFGGGIAKLFGSFDLADLLPAGSLGKNAPKLRTESQDIPGGKLVIATLDWEPEVESHDFGIAAFSKDHGGITKLVIHGRIEKPVTISAPASSAAKFEFNGKLNDFQVSVLNAVFLNFKEFGFVAKSGAKTDVSVKLDPAKPLEFAGDLQFVEELRKAIPPDLFGAGPSLDIAPTGIRAGFAFGLPPLSVGVFALKDVALGAALTLPFLDGKPTFDFNVSTREHPFLLAVMFFGGGGFFRLQLDTAGIRVVEAALEFGAQASIDIGVASGGVFIMAGIYFKLEREDPGTELLPLLSGYLRMGGYLSVLGLIKVSLEFNLSFTYDGAQDKAYGRATLIVKVEILFFSTSVDVTVERAFGGSSGDPKFIEQFTAPAVWRSYAEAFA